MKRTIEKTGYALQGALRGLRGSPVGSGIAVATVATTLLLAGAFVLLLTNMERLIERFGDDIKLAVYLDPTLDEKARQQLSARLVDLPEVETVVYISPAEALSRFRAGVGANSGLLAGLEENPLPPALELTLYPERRAARSLRQVSETVAGWDGVDDVGAGAEWLEGYNRAVELVRTLGLGIGTALGAAALLIVANTIRLALYARREEIEILRLVGASPAFVAAPFLLEGLAQGALGGVVALALLALAFYLASPIFGSATSLLLGYGEPIFLSSAASVMLLGLGSAVGLVGAMLAVFQRRRA